MLSAKKLSMEAPRQAECQQATLLVTARTTSAQAAWDKLRHSLDVKGVRRTVRELPKRNKHVTRYSTLYTVYCMIRGTVHIFIFTYELYDIRNIQIYIYI